MNVLAAVIVVLGGLIAACLRVVFGLSIPAVAGIYSGATTNTPSLAAAQAVLQGFKGQSSDNTDLLGDGLISWLSLWHCRDHSHDVLMRNVSGINPEAEAIARNIKADLA